MNQLKWAQFGTNILWTNFAFRSFFLVSRLSLLLLQLIIAV